MAKLSIIIPTFNSAATIQRCLRSIQVQTFTDYEIIIQDGGSTDRTADLIQDFELRNPGVKFEFEQEPDEGPYEAMNKGLRRASGDWLYFLGSDDELYDENVFDKVLYNPEAADCDVVYGNVQMVGSAVWAPDGAIYDGPFDLSKLLKTNISHQAIFYKASFCREVGSYNEEYVVCADWDFNMRCWAKGRFGYVDVLVAKFYSGGISSRNRPDPHFEADMTTNIIQYFGKKAEKARRPTNASPGRVLKALARRLGISR